MPFDVCKLVCKFWGRIWDQGGSKMGISDEKVRVPGPFKLILLM